MLSRTNTLRSLCTARYVRTVRTSTPVRAEQSRADGACLQQRNAAQRLWGAPVARLCKVQKSHALTHTYTHMQNAHARMHTLPCTLAPSEVSRLPLAVFRLLGAWGLSSRKQWHSTDRFPHKATAAACDITRTSQVIRRTDGIMCASWSARQKGTESRELVYRAAVFGLVSVLNLLMCQKNSLKEPFTVQEQRSE